MNDVNQSATDYSQYVGFWVRFIAAFIDLVIYTPLYLLIESVFGTPYQLQAEAVFTIIGLITYALFFASKWQASPGMYLLKFHVCDVEGNRISFGRALSWGISSTIGILLCCGGILYMQQDVKIVKDMLASCAEQQIEVVDCIPEIEKLIGIPYENFEQLLIASIGFSFFLLLVWTLAIALPKDKTGFHNLMCRTRFVKGRA